MILVRNLKLYPAEPIELLRHRAAKKLRLDPERITSLLLTKKSLDARRKDDIHYVCSAALSVTGDEERVIARAKSGEVGNYAKPE